MTFCTSMVSVSPIPAHFFCHGKIVTSPRDSDAIKIKLGCSSSLLARCDVSNGEDFDRFTNGHLVSLSKEGKIGEARQLMEQMVDISMPIWPDSYRALFKACEKCNSLQETRRIHELLRKEGKCSVFNNNWIIRLYSGMGSLIDARKVFDEMVERNLVSWGTIISAYAHRGHVRDSFGLFIDMLHFGLELNSVIYVCLLKCLSDPSLLEIGKQLHSHILKSPLSYDAILNSALLNMYVKCDWLEGAERVFCCMEEKNIASWTALMVGYTQAEMEKNVLSLFINVVNDGAKLDEFLFSIVFRACASLENLTLGKQIHGLIAKLGLECDVSVGTPLVDFYVKCKNFECASKAFAQIAEPNDVSWSALVAGLCQNNEFEESLKIFRSLRKKQWGLNSFFYTNIFQACSALADFVMGEQVHADAIKSNMIAPLHGESALITMYSRCGLLDYANQIFESMSELDTVAWTSMIVGYAFQGDGIEALKLFKMMQDINIKPNSVTFIAILSACSHSGLVIEGEQYLESMRSKHGINPSVEHYNCMIDTYSRAGHLEQAFDLILNMPLPPDSTSWKCLLGGCCTYKNLEIGEIAAKNLLQLDPYDTAGYVLMFNLYVSFQKWEEAVKIRKLMAERSLRKEPGYSWIIVGGQVYQFVVGDKNHSQTSAIYSKLVEISNGFAKVDNVLLAEEDVPTNMLGRKQQISVHSERLAIAFGLLATPNNVTIRIFKNLRTCKDCHDFCKHVSVVTGREIVVRDSLRFHHFRNGECSCNDYW